MPEIEKRKADALEGAIVEGGSRGELEVRIASELARRLAGFDEAVVSLYAKGLTTGEIQAHLEQVYDVQISRSLVSKVTEKVAAELESWRPRTLDAVYAVMYVDGLYVKGSGFRP